MLLPNTDIGQVDRDRFRHTVFSHAATDEFAPGVLKSSTDDLLLPFLMVRTVGERSHHDREVVRTASGGC